MNESLNHPGHTSWPEWHSQPLRLTAAEIENPKQVFEEFFQCYHLPDIRTCLNNWLQDALGRESADNKQHYETHLQVEKLVEAAWLVHKTPPSTKEATFPVVPEFGSEVDFNEIDTVLEVYQKEPRLIDLARRDPLLAIKEVFAQEELWFIKEHVTQWLYLSMITELRDYTEAIHRDQLIHFQKAILPLIEAVYIIYERAGAEYGSNNNLSPLTIDHQKPFYNTPSLLSTEQKANPASVIHAFFKRFPLLYIYRELWEWLYAGLSVPNESDEFSDCLCGIDVLSTYDRVLCLIESAHQLIRLGIITTNTATTA